MTTKTKKTDEEFLAYVAHTAQRHNLIMPADPKLFFSFCADVLTRELDLIDAAESQILDD